MVVHQGDEDEVTSASTASEATTRAVDISASATPSGTPSDSLDRDADPKQMINSTDDIESNPELPPASKEDGLSNPNEDSNPENIRNTNETNMQRPPPSYASLKKEAQLVEKEGSNGKKSSFY